MAPRTFIAALLVVFLVTAQAARPLQPAAGAVGATLSAPIFDTLPSAALRKLMEPEKPNKPTVSKIGDSAAAAFKRLAPSGH